MPENMLRLAKNKENAITCFNRRRDRGLYKKIRLSGATERKSITHVGDRQTIFVSFNDDDYKPWEVLPKREMLFGQRKVETSK